MIQRLCDICGERSDARTGRCEIRLEFITTHGGQETLNFLEHIDVCSVCAHKIGVPILPVLKEKVANNPNPMPNKE